MESVGNEGQIPRPTEEQSREQLQGNIAKFQNALASYSRSEHADERDHLGTIMDKQIELIRANVREIKRSGVQKQGFAVSDEYQKYKDNPSEQNLTALEQDVSTLREYGNLPITQSPDEGG